MSATANTKKAPSKQKSGSRMTKKKDAEKPKRCCNAFCFFLKEQQKATASHGPELMKNAYEQWNKMTTEEKAKFQEQAEADKKRYLHEKEEHEKKRVKRPCMSAYMQFMSDFLKKNTNKKSYSEAKDAVSAGAQQWKSMTDQEKAPWNKLAKEACSNYKANASRLLKVATAKATVKAPTLRAAVNKNKAKAGVKSVKFSKSKPAKSSTKAVQLSKTRPASKKKMAKSSPKTTGKRRRSTK